MKRDWNAMAQGILDAVGGPENISGMTHCATRLRLNLKDDAACDDAAVKEVEGVVNTLNKAGQYQVLIGTEVPKLYEKFEPLVKGSGVEISAATKDEGESIVSQVFSAISGIFAPLLPAMAGSGILRGFVILAAQLGIIAEGTGTYTILYTLAMSVFYFLPCCSASPPASSSARARTCRRCSARACSTRTSSPSWATRATAP